MSQQQTVLRVQTNIPHATISGTTEFTTLDLYSDIPIKINKSFAELQDIGSKNSDYSIGLSLPGSKKNNVFFESFFNVDTQSLYFNATQNIACSVLISDQSYFTGYMKLNKVSVMNSKVEYDVTLFSSIGNLFGEIGNNLLKDLDFDDPEYTFNHTFDFYDSIADPYENQSSNFGRKNEKPFMYYYPIVHNGYEYTGSTVNVSGGTAESQTRLYTSTLPIGSFPSLTGLTGYKPYRINSQGPDDGTIDNQLKPALSMWGLIKLIFKTYNYTITSDFMNTPWMKTLYMYGYYGSDKTKFSYKIQTIQALPLEGVELIYSGSTVAGSQLNIIVCKRGTGIPCFSTQDVPYGFANMFPYSEFGTIPRGTSGLTITAVEGFDFGFEVGGVPVADISTLKYTPKNVGDSVNFVDGDFVNFNLVIDENIKQIDILSSIAKKFNLVFIPDPDNSRNIIIESYPYYVGTGNVYDWTPKLSYDKGFTVEPALNYIESNIIFTDQEDGDYGNKQFKDRNKQIYGQKNFYGPTNFKSQEKKIDTIFSPQVLRQWDTADQLGADVSQGIKLPLGINYVGSSSTREIGNSTETFYAYKGLKSKPKLFWFLGSANLFLDTLGEAYETTGFTTYDIKILSSDKSLSRSVRTAPIISHTMPMGMSDTQKINNDNACILFNSEQPVDVGVSTYNTYTENDVYSLFYSNRIDNLYDVNTRFVKGYFDLKLSDINNLKTNDIIKIQEQYFIVNKINGFNLTNRELTEVELLQYNLTPQQYPTRYFKYQYCDQPGYCFKIKTDFTNPRLIDTQFGWSVWYDQSIGTFTGSTTPTGFTSCILDSGNGRYVPFTISEITKDEYDNGGCYDISCDSLIQFEWNFVNVIFPNVEYAFGLGLPSFWQNGAGTYEGLNLWPDCASFQTTRTTYGILTGSSVNHGNNLCLPNPNDIADLSFWVDFSDNSFYDLSGISMTKIYSKVDNTVTHELNRATTIWNFYYQITGSSSNPSLNSAYVHARPNAYQAQSWNTADDNAIVVGPKTDTSSYPNSTMFIVINKVPSVLYDTGYLISRYNGSNSPGNGLIYNSVTPPTTNSNFITRDYNGTSGPAYNTTGQNNMILTRVNSNQNALLYNGSTLQNTVTDANTLQNRTTRQFYQIGRINFSNVSSGVDNIPIGTYICEIIIYNRVLTNAELTQTWNYLSNKWNITL